MTTKFDIVVEQISGIVESHGLIDSKYNQQLDVILHDASELSFSIINLMKSLNDSILIIEKCVENTNKKQEIAEKMEDILGRIQYQDILRQRIERMQNIMTKRQTLLEQFVTQLQCHSNEIDDFSLKMRELLNEYIENESRHSNSLEFNEEQLPPFELF
ncbi:MAG: hypothetical protein WBI40_02630 [Methylococcaceae bacterium]